MENALRTFLLKRKVLKISKETYCRKLSFSEKVLVFSPDTTVSGNKVFGVSQGTFFKKSLWQGSGQRPDTVFISWIYP